MKQRHNANQGNTVAGLGAAFHLPQRAHNGPAGKAQAVEAAAIQRCPRAAQRARDAMPGQAITPEPLKTTWPAKEFNVLAQSFRNAMSSEKRDACNALDNDQSRRALLAQYAIDPESAKCMGTNSIATYSDNKTVSGVYWLKREELESSK